MTFLAKTARLWVVSGAVAKLGGVAVIAAALAFGDGSISITWGASNG